MDHFTEALRLNPAYDNAYYNMGNVLYAQGKYEEAAAYFREALRLTPGLVRAHVNLGNVFYSQEKYDEAAAEYTTVLRLNPGNAEAHNNLGAVLSSQGKDQAALRITPRRCGSIPVTPMPTKTCEGSSPARRWILPDERRKDGPRFRRILYQAPKPYREVAPELAPTRLKLAHD